jgi:AbiV family abortive infection protein
MRPSNIPELAFLPNEELVPIVAEGLDLMAASAVELWEEARTLWKRLGSPGHQLLSAYAVEESAKFLILFDLIRSPVDANLRKAHLRKYTDHLAKAIYAEACHWRPATLKEFKAAIHGERLQFFRDGPNDDDWSFYNRLLDHREDSMYVDYVKFDAEARWVSPRRTAQLLGSVRPYLPRSIRLVQALGSLRIADPQKLAAVARLWTAAVIDEEATAREVWEMNRKTAEALIDTPCPDEKQAAAIADVVDLLPFPMYGFDLSVVKVKREDAKSWKETRIPSD